MKARLLLVTVISACLSWSVGLCAQEDKGHSWAPVTEPPAAPKAAPSAAKKTVAAPGTAPTAK